MSSSSKEPIAQACAVPFRLRNGRIEFCLITSSRKRRWGFPKGIIDPGETHEETALKEAEEEAGLHGQIVGEPLGIYTYEKWNSDLVVTVVLMRVRRTLNDWPERSLRQRQWVQLDTARLHLAHPRQKELLEVAVERILAQAGD